MPAAGMPASHPKLLEEIFEQDPDGIIVGDAHGRVLFLNPAARRMHGFTAGEPVPDLPSSRFGWRLQDKSTPWPAERTPFARAVLGGSVDDVEVYIHRPRPRGGLWCRMSARPFKDSHGRPAGAVLVIRESAARHRAEKEHAKLSAVIESADDAIICTSLDGLVTDWNPAAERIFGYAAAEIIGRPIEILMPPELRSQEDEVQERVRRGEKVEHFEVRRLRKDGRPIDLSLTVSPIKDAEGGILGFSGVSRDITIEKRMQEVLRSKAADLSRANTELELFGSIASHELQAPLRKIVSFGEMLKTRGAAALDDEARGYLEKMQKAATRVGLLVDGLRELAQIDAKPGAQESVELGPLISEILSDMREALDEAGGSVEFEADPSAAVHGNPAQLREVFQNLLSNAVKFRRKEEPLRVKVICRDLANGLIQVSIDDNGMGFEARFAEEIFRPFRRLQGAEYEGIGMGLSLCQKIVARHGGGISTRSRPGKGSVFIVTLPVFPS